MTSPLSDIRVLDMSRILAGPWAGQLLGQHTREVLAQWLGYSDEQIQALQEEDVL